MKHRLLIIRMFQLVEISLFLSTLGVWYLVTTGQLPLWQATTWGDTLGTVSVFLLVTALAPGITRRLGKLPGMSRWIMPFRRHVGILMFITAWSHALLVNYLPRYTYGTLLVFPPVYVTFGLLALLAAIPPFVTSNDFSVRMLKRNWAKVQKLVYLVLLLVLLHVTLQGVWISWVAGATLGLEVVSYWVAGKRKIWQ